MDAIVIDTPEAIERFRVSALIRALDVEVRFGLKVSQHNLISVARGYGFTGRTKRQALDFMTQYRVDTYGE